MKEENYRSFLGKLFFRRALLLAYELLPLSWRALCCLLPSTEGNLRVYHRNCLTRQRPVSSALGTSGLLCQRLSVPLSVCAATEGVHCELIFEAFWPFGFHFCGQTPLLKLWGEDVRKRKLNAKTFLHHYWTVQMGEFWKFSDDLNHFHFFGKALAEVDSVVLAGTPQQLLPDFLQVW